MQPLFPHDHLLSPAIKLPDDCESFEKYKITKENIAKTWRYFSDSFITIKKRNGKEEPLLPPQSQQNLRENLSLKLQLVQWSASERKQKLYNQNLNDIQLWIEKYFDMTAVENKNFYQGIQKLKSEVVSYDYPSTLSSLDAIRKVLAVQPLKPIIDKLKQESHTDEVPQIELEEKLQEKLQEKLNSSSEAV